MKKNVKNSNNVIPFPGSIRLSRKELIERYINDEPVDPFELVEVVDKLDMDDDFALLIPYLKKTIQKYPLDLFARLELANTYHFAEQDEKALEIFLWLHKKCPQDDMLQSEIVDVLYECGKSVDDFEWVNKPVLVWLDNVLLDYCYKILEPNITRCPIKTLYYFLLNKGKNMFSLNPLTEALENDGRFIVTEDGYKNGNKYVEVRKDEPDV
ncbi:MAG: hypothetical protein GXP53_05500 [Deltaproteobacteria bacterium]|nr:hypothetical protein [Deltaproteobacteria bacterium]